MTFRRPILLAVVVAAVVSGSAKHASAVMLNPVHWAVVDEMKGQWRDFEGRDTWRVTYACEDMQGITCNADGYITRLSHLALSGLHMWELFTCDAAYAYAAYAYAAYAYAAYAYAAYAYASYA
ncbi:unnamed protein product [Closterium sp. Yama58-4]|nr:unnamed protein product [Closterium sp. Yama58-4]